MNNLPNTIDATGGASCGDCVFALWVQASTDASGPILYGFCRRNPPTPLLKTIIQEPKLARPGPPEIIHQIEPAYPPTNSRQWCGEHETPGAFFANRFDLNNEDEIDEGPEQ